MARHLNFTFHQTLAQQEWPWADSNYVVVLHFCNMIDEREIAGNRYLEK